MKSMPTVVLSGVKNFVVLGLAVLFAMAVDGAGRLWAAAHPPRGPLTDAELPDAEDCDLANAESSVRDIVEEFQDELPPEFEGGEQK